MPLTSSIGWRAAGWSVVILAAAPVWAAVLFPDPLHLRKEVHDPITGTTTTIEEYCSGNRIITVHGGRVVIADYERGELTEIDRNAATFSVTPFTDVARHHPATELKTSPAPELRPVAPKRSFDGRSLETYEFARKDGAEQVTLQIAVDRQVRISAAAVEALIGAAFPSRRTFAHDAVLRAAAPAGTRERRMQTDAAAEYALPVEQQLTYEIGGEQLTFRSTVTLVERITPPAELTMIPPGARRVESKLTAVPRLLDEIDNIRPQP